MTVKEGKKKLGPRRLAPTRPPTIVDNVCKHVSIGDLDLATHILLASGITSKSVALPTLSGATGRRVTGDIGRASSCCAKRVSITAEDDIAAHAVGGIGLGAVDLVVAQRRGLRVGQSRGGSDDNYGRCLHDCDGGGGTCWVEKEEVEMLFMCVYGRRWAYSLSCDETDEINEIGVL